MASIEVYRSIEEMKAGKSKRPTLPEEMAPQKDALKSLNKLQYPTKTTKVQAR